jgi:hypothetical protein
LVCAVGLGSDTTNPDSALFANLGRSLRILVALDFDGARPDGTRPGARAAEKWLTTYPGQARRWPVPEGKDPGDYAVLGGDLREWVNAGLPPVMLLGPSDKNRVESPLPREGGAEAGAGRVAEKQAEAEQDVHEDVKRLLAEMSKCERITVKVYSDQERAGHEIWGCAECLQVRDCGVRRRVNLMVGLDCSQDAWLWLKARGRVTGSEARSFGYHEQEG